MSEETDPLRLFKKWLSPEPPPSGVTYPPAEQTMPAIHLHNLVLIGAQAGMRVPMQPSTTVILYGCADCEHVESSVIEGSWTEAQLLRLHGQPPNKPEQPITGMENS